MLSRRNSSVTDGLQAIIDLNYLWIFFHHSNIVSCAKCAVKQVLMNDLKADDSIDKQITWFRFFHSEIKSVYVCMMKQPERNTLHRQFDIHSTGNKVVYQNRRRSCFLWMNEWMKASACPWIGSQSCLPKKMRRFNYIDRSECLWMKSWRLEQILIKNFFIQLSIKAWKSQKKLLLRDLWWREKRRTQNWSEKTFLLYFRL